MPSPLQRTGLPSEMCPGPEFHHVGLFKTASCHLRPTRSRTRFLAEAGMMLTACVATWSAEVPSAEEFRKEVQPVLERYCYDCHADGVNKGEIAFDTLKPGVDDSVNQDLWWKVLKNVRAGLMPPARKPQPTPEERAKLERWIKYSAFGIDPNDVDPGRVTVRRLNRVEYQNTIRDLMGVSFDTSIEFPPDDTGYGFDNIGDVLTVSPMLLEKYVAAAKTIVTAIPTVSRIPAESVLGGKRFRPVAEDGKGDGDTRPRNSRQEETLVLSFEKPAEVATTFEAKHAGLYQLRVDLGVRGPFNFEPATCRISFKADGRELLQKEFGWQDNKSYQFTFEEHLDPGEHVLAFELQPLMPSERDQSELQMRIVGVTVRGPMEDKFWVKPPNHERFFPRDVPPSLAERRDYARELMATFAARAFRRPVDDSTVDRLVKLAESIYTQPGKTFETGIAHATAAVLASPRFLFRIEEIEPDTPDKARFAQVDEYSLASRLSYFLWATMPDDELSGLAQRGELRRNLSAQVKRMLADPRSEALVENFTGQWLQTRDVDGMTIDARVVFARDNGTEREMRERRAAFERFLAEQQAANRAGGTNLAGGTNTLGRTNLFAGPNARTGPPGQTNQAGRRGFNFGQFRPPRAQLDGEVRQALKRETQLTFSSVMREDRPVTELIDSDYTFLNEKLANYYGLTNLNIDGPEMRRVTLPPDSPRGGILTQGSVLVVTSNPDRTSPVKRGLFVLANVLGTPAPPPPGNVPSLEVAEKDFKDHDPTLRESLALHREAPLCASCHARMDPIGLAFENFNALGLWREKERNQTIDPSGKLITGEPFESVHALKRILANERRADFYRCLSEKLLFMRSGAGWSITTRKPWTSSLSASKKRTAVFSPC